MPNHTFLTWLIATALVLTGSFWAWQTGVFQEVWSKDVTHITSLIALTFVTVYSRLGYLSWKISTGRADPHTTKRQLKLGVFYGVFCFTLGIIGTVIGFILMLKSGGLAKDMADPAVQSTLLTGIIGHLATALYCTAAGIISGAIIQKLTFILLYAMEAQEDAG